MKPEMIVNLFEALTIFCFGLSWPVSIRKSFVSRTAKGKSLLFEIFILVGYAFGIARKLIQIFVMGERISFVTLEGWLFFFSFIFYILNSIEISVDLGLYVRNVRLDREAKARHARKNESAAKELQDTRDALEEARRLLRENGIVYPEQKGPESLPDTGENAGGASR